MDFKLSSNHVLVDAWIIFEDGKKIPLEEKHDRRQRKSRCLFFNEVREAGEFSIKFRLDFSDLDREGNPRLDVDIFKKGSKKIRYKSNSSDWHHTSKTLEGGTYRYVWELNTAELKIPELVFFFQSTNEQTISGRARIVKAAD